MGQINKSIHKVRDISYLINEIAITEENARLIQKKITYIERVMSDRLDEETKRYNDLADTFLNDKLKSTSICYGKTILDERLKLRGGSIVKMFDTDNVQFEDLKCHRMLVFG